MNEHVAARRPTNRIRLRDRRYATRFPLVADAELLDLESGASAEGLTSDISMGGCFVCTSQPLASRARVIVSLTRKGQTVKALAVVRTVKPRLGFGIEFMDMDSSSHDILVKWIEAERQ